MTTQEAYELARVYLGRPGARRATDRVTEACRYETQIEGQTHRCGVGCLLGPGTLAQEVFISQEYAETLGTCQGNRMVALRDFMGSLGNIYDAGYQVPELNGVSREFLEDLQFLHDASHSWAGDKFDVDALDNVARRHGLTVVIDEAKQTPDREVVAV